MCGLGCHVARTTFMAHVFAHDTRFISKTPVLFIPNVNDLRRHVWVYGVYDSLVDRNNVGVLRRQLFVHQIGATVTLKWLRLD